MKYKKIRLYLTIAFVCNFSFFGACSNEKKVGLKSGPAILLESNIENTLIISQAMSLALNGTKISLNSRTFMRSPHHTLEKKQLTNLNSNIANGLILSIPKIYRFSLFSHDTSCFLIYQNSGKKFPLSGVKCKPL